MMSELLSDAVRFKDAYALVVGISQYRDGRISRLNFTHADAQAFCDLLLDSRRAGFPKENVKLLLDEQATLFNIKHAISGWLFQRATGDSTVIVFFAGHGGQESDKTHTEADGIAKYLLPWDADVDNLFASALSNDEFKRLLNTIRARRLVIFMDACYSAGVTSRGARDLGIVGNPFDRLAEGEGRLVIASAQPNQRSWEDLRLGHGIFTYHLLEALQGKADLDKDGYVSVMEVFQYLEREVPKSARRFANSVQDPLWCGDMAKDIILTTDAKRIVELLTRRKAEVQEKLRQLFDLHVRGDLPTDAYEEALRLIEKPREEMTSEESELAQYLNALLQNGISVELYLKTRTFMQRPSGSPPPPPPPTLSGRHHPDVKQFASDQVDVKTTMRFCIHCGTRILAQNKFCIGCGQPVRQ